MAGDLVVTVRDIRLKKDSLLKEIEQDESQKENIETQLDVMKERKDEIEKLIKSLLIEKENLTSVIVETQQTKEKVMESLKYLNTHLKKMTINNQV